MEVTLTRVSAFAESLMSRKKGGSTNKVENQVIRSLDNLADYEEFTTELAPVLRRLLKKGLTAEQIENDPKIQSLLVARQMNIALLEMDSSKALAAIKDIRDRTTGKATEKVEVTSKLEKLPDEQLDALLRTKLGERDEEKEEVH